MPKQRKSDWNAFMQNSSQDFVDKLNLQIMPQMGYKLVKENGLYYWDWKGVDKYPANEETRNAHH